MFIFEFAYLRQKFQEIRWEKKCGQNSRDSYNNQWTKHKMPQTRINITGFSLLLFHVYVYYYRTNELYCCLYLVRRIISNDTHFSVFLMEKWCAFYHFLRCFFFLFLYKLGIHSQPHWALHTFVYLFHCLSLHCSVIRGLSVWLSVKSCSVSLFRILLHQFLSPDYKVFFFFFRSLAW